MGAKKRIIIIGGGFAGVKCARELARARTGAEVVLVNRDNHMVFQPLLADVAGSALNPRAVAAPLRQMLRGVRCLSEEITAIDPEGREVTWRGVEGNTERLSYDELVLAVGNRVDLSRVPGMANHALPLKNVGDAIAMRARVMERLEQAESTSDPELRRRLLSYVVIGGGFSGVEVAGEINDLVRDASRYYEHVDEKDLRIVLVHSRAQILPEVNTRLRDFALKRMEKAGVEFVLEARAAAVTRHGVRLQDGREVAGATVICTVGNAPHEFIQRLDVPKDRGRIKTDPDMSVEGLDDIWAVGDCALVPNAHDDKLSPPTAQFAERQGGQVAANIVRKLKGHETRPFSFKPVGVAAGIGSRSGVAELFGVRVSGFPAWWLWRSAFLVKLPSFVQKIKVGFDWAWEVVFPRDLNYFKGATTRPVTASFFAPGENVATAANSSQQLYVIDKGECELVEKRTDGDDRTLAVFGRGEMVGAQSLRAFDTEGEIEIRARSNTEVVAIAENFLEQISGVLKPVQQLIERASLTHEDLWGNIPRALSQLDQVSCETIMSPLPETVFGREESVLAGFKRLTDSGEPMGLILDDGRIAGLVTRTDLIQGIRGGLEATVGEAMTRDPLVARQVDSAAVAATTMQDHGLKSLPIVDAESGCPLGLLHAESLMTWVLGRISLTPQGDAESNETLG